MTKLEIRQAQILAQINGPEMLSTAQREELMKELGDVRKRIAEAKQGAWNMEGAKPSDLSEEEFRAVMRQGPGAFKVLPDGVCPCCGQKT